MSAKLNQSNLKNLEDVVLGTTEFVDAAAVAPYAAMDGFHPVIVNSRKFSKIFFYRPANLAQRLSLRLC